MGFILGVTAEVFIEAQQLADMRDAISKLSLENEQLRQEAKHEVIEIVDKRTTNDEIKFGDF